MTAETELLGDQRGPPPRVTRTRRGVAAGSEFWGLPDHADEIPEFVFDFLGGTDQFADEGTKGIAEATAQVVDGFVERSQVHSQLAGEIGSRRGFVAAGEEAAETFEHQGAVSFLVAALDAGEGLLHQGPSPLTVEGFFGGGGIGRGQIAGGVQGKVFGAATPLLGPGRVVAIDQVILQARGQETAEPAAGAGDLFEGAPFQERSDESLDHIVGLVMVETPETNIGAQGRAIPMTQLFERLFGRRGSLLDGPEELGPVRGRKERIAMGFAFPRRRGGFRR